MSHEGKGGETYRQAGVDIDAGNQAVKLMAPLARATFRPEVLTGLGGFSGLFALDTEKYRQPVLVSGTDGVGTKLKIAFLMDRHDTVGVDAVAMCVNDLLVTGAEPLFFLDYLAVGKLDPEKAAQVVAGVAEGCRQAGCALIGGETAEMPGFYPPGEYDLAGFAVGVVEREAIIDGRGVSAGDLVVGLPSAGLHSNGYSLARRIFFEKLNWDVKRAVPEFGCTLGEELLKPTRIYVSLVHALLKALPDKSIKAMAHITGGGLMENLARTLPEHLDARLEKGRVKVPPVFQVLQREGGISETEMYRTFNMGVGFCLILAPEALEILKSTLKTLGEDFFVLGKITAGTGKVRCI